MLSFTPAFLATAAVIVSLSLVAYQSTPSSDSPLRRQLSALSQFSDPKSVAAAGLRLVEPITVVNVYYTLTVQEPRRPSIFETNLLERYGSGHAKYNIIYDSDCNCDEGPIRDDTPCVAAARPTRADGNAKTKAKGWISKSMQCPIDCLKRRYPKCITLSVDDELCRMTGFDARLYRTSTESNALYIPLGHRKDSWDSFQQITGGEEMKLRSTLQRDYMYNAIYSENTNRKERMKLHKILEQDGMANNFSSFVQITQRWSRNANSPKSDQLNTDDYIRVLLNSIFTLAPLGKNPDCFRLYEAVEAGSIPITVLGEAYDTHPCTGSLEDWVNSPMIFLPDWGELRNTLSFFRKHPKALAKKQMEMMDWYSKYMHTVIMDFENLVINNNALLTQERQ